MDQLNRIKGGLLGVAVGDAIGGTTEFMSKNEIVNEYGFLREILGGGVWNLERGEVTDDTMMTICVAEGILDAPDNPMQAIGERFLAWYQTKPKDIGNIIRQVFRWYNGDWFNAAIKAHNKLSQSAGNGSLMRCLPVAFCYTNIHEIENISRIQSRMTHYDQRCEEACVINNRIAYRLLQGEQLAAAIEQEIVGTEYSDVLFRKPDCDTSAFVVHTFSWSLYLLLQAKSFEDAVTAAANLGGDTDTIAAITGGLAGVYYGYDGIPENLVDAIIICEQLKELARRIEQLREGR